MGIIVALGALIGGMIGVGGTILALIIATVRKHNDKENSWWLGFIASFAICAPISGLISAFVVASHILNQI